MSAGKDSGTLKHCVFCGNPPSTKTREHILPAWLLELTGDPRRTAIMAFDSGTGEPISFSWSSLTMPACEACNSRYSMLESATKPIVLRLLARDQVTEQQILLLLDWLDKVRICLWLNQLILQKKRIEPHFRVDSRIGTKDRMISVYKLPGLNPGLNGIGIYTPVFAHHPSCFTLRINDLALLNISADFAFAERCGAPVPKTRECLVDGPDAGKIRFSDWVRQGERQHPLIEFPVPRFDLQAVQAQFLIEGVGSFRGSLLHQRHNRVTRFTTGRARPAGHVSGPSRLREIVAATYRIQSHLFRTAGRLVGSRPEAVAKAEEAQRRLCEANEYRAREAEDAVFLGELGLDQEMHFPRRL